MPDGINDALLIYNPTSGRRRHRRFLEVEQAARILKDAGISTELAPTTARASATSIARQAVEQRRGMVIVCGGDGTINEVVNGLAGSRVPMALLPAGTANILAKELGSRKVTVNAVAPGPVATDLFLKDKTQAQIEQFVKLAPLERLGQPEDIANVVSFLAGPDGAWVNGQVLRANGGFA